MQARNEFDSELYSSSAGSTRKRPLTFVTRGKQMIRIDALYKGGHCVDPIANFFRLGIFTKDGIIDNAFVACREALTSALHRGERDASRIEASCMLTQ